MKVESGVQPAERNNLTSYLCEDIMSTEFDAMPFFMIVTTFEPSCLNTFVDSFLFWHFCKTNQKPNIT